jgi:hypothetical protein
VPVPPIIQTKATIANLSKRFDIWQVHRPASAEPLEARQISVDECIFCVRPFLELALSHHGVRFSRKRFLVDENDGRSAARPHGTTSGVVCRYSFADIGAVSDVEGTIGTAKDVNEAGTAFNHPRRPRDQRMPFDRLRAFDSLFRWFASLLAMDAKLKLAGPAMSEHSESNGGGGNRTRLQFRPNLIA